MADLLTGDYRKDLDALQLLMDRVQDQERVISEMKDRLDRANLV